MCSVPWAPLVKRNIRCGDLAARFGEEEFVVALPNTSLERPRSLPKNPGAGGKPPIQRPVAAMARHRQHRGCQPGRTPTGFGGRPPAGGRSSALCRQVFGKKPDRGALRITPPPTGRCLIRAYLSRMRRRAPCCKMQHTPAVKGFDWLLAGGKLRRISFKIA